MRRKTKTLLPVVNALHKLGEDINEARRRRGITMALLAERAGINVITLSSAETV